MELKVLNEAGYDEALYAMSLSYFDDTTDVNSWWSSQREKAIKRSAKMCHQGSGHNDFLTMTSIWIDMKLPFFMWKQLDRSQIGFRKMSASTMHTLQKTGLQPEMFEHPPQCFNFEEFNIMLKDKTNIEYLANEIPDGFLQRRCVLTNYMTLRNIIFQRYDHRLQVWQKFCRELYQQVQHPEFLPNNPEILSKLELAA